MDFYNNKRQHGGLQQKRRCISGMNINGHSQPINNHQRKYRREYGGYIHNYATWLFLQTSVWFDKW